MPLQLKKIWRSTMKTASGFMSMFSRPSAAESPSVKLYRSIHDLPLHRFVECITTDSLHSLIIEGTPSEDELKTTWHKIADQYSASVGNYEYQIYLNCFKEAATLAVDLQNIEFLIEALRKAFYQPLLDALNKAMQTSVVLEGLEKEAYNKELDSLYRRSRGLKIRLHLKKAQYDALSKKFEGTGEKPSRDYFESMMITLSDHAGFQLSMNMSVFEYCERLKRFIQYVEKMNNKKWQK